MKKGQIKNRKWWVWKLTQKYGFICWYCGVDLNSVSYSVDHIIAESRGGCDSEDNLALACFTCNRAKYSLDLFLFLKWLSHIRSSNFKSHIAENFNSKLLPLEAKATKRTPYATFEGFELDRLKKSFY